MSSREKTQADFDLERFIDMFDEALTSKDERVINALRSLMMMVILTKPEGRKDAIGPLRQLFDDLHNINRRMHSMEDTVRQLEYHHRREFEDQKRNDIPQWPTAKDYYNNGMSEQKYRSMLNSINGPGPTKFTKP